MTDLFVLQLLPGDPGGAGRRVAALAKVAFASGDARAEMVTLARDPVLRMRTATATFRV